MLFAICNHGVCRSQRTRYYPILAHVGGQVPDCMRCERDSKGSIPTVDICVYHDSHCDIIIIIIIIII